jgi:hypothetical protein
MTGQKNLGAKGLQQCPEISGLSVVICLCSVMSMATASHGACIATPQ